MNSVAAQERAARNESLFREVNEQIKSGAPGLGSLFTEFVCECADDACLEHISLTLEEYESVRKASPAHFVIKPGHVYLDVERVVGGDDGRYEVVEKGETAAELAAELDTRSR